MLLVSFYQIVCLMGCGSCITINSGSGIKISNCLFTHFNPYDQYGDSTNKYGANTDAYAITINGGNDITLDNNNFWGDGSGNCIC